MAHQLIDLYEKLAYHDTMSPNRARLTTAPAVSKDRIYFMYLYTHQTLVGKTTFLDLPCSDQLILVARIAEALSNNRQQNTERRRVTRCMAGSEDARRRGSLPHC